MMKTIRSKVSCVFCCMFFDHFCDSHCFFFFAVTDMNVPYASKEEMLQEWLAPEDAEALGLNDMERAKSKDEKLKKIHEELDTLPRCAQHGTVSKTFLFLHRCSSCLYFKGSVIIFLCWLEMLIVLYDLANASTL